MARTGTVTVPIALDLNPAADAILNLASSLEVAGAFLRGEAEKLRTAPEAALRAQAANRRVAEAEAIIEDLHPSADADGDLAPDPLDTEDGEEYRVEITD